MHDHPGDAHDDPAHDYAPSDDYDPSDDYALTDDLSALDFSPAAADTHDDGSDLGAFEVYSPGGEPSSDADPPSEDDDAPLITATNPPATVSVVAQISGAVHRVELAPAVTHMTEPQLAEEIRVVADVAAKKATSAMYIFVSELLVAQGIDRATAETFVQSNMTFATPAMARAAEAALVARHTPEC
jgi:ESX secretion-associated protein EspD/H